MGTGKARAGVDAARLCAFVTTSLEAVANPADAPQMAAYMKTDMPFFGVKKPDRVPIVRALKRDFAPPDRDTYERWVRALWRLPHREEKYVALALARQSHGFIEPASLPLYEDLIRDGAWWDFVDEVAVQLVGQVVARYPAAGWPLMDQWIGADDMWLRRSAIICQLKHKEATDEARLFRYCRARAHESEFFIRKAIGWALREYAKTRPDRVRAFLAEMGGQLSGLSRREASKHL